MIDRVSLSFLNPWRERTRPEPPPPEVQPVDRVDRLCELKQPGARVTPSDLKDPFLYLAAVRSDKELYSLAGKQRLKGERGGAVELLATRRWSDWVNSPCEELDQAMDVIGMQGLTGQVGAADLRVMLAAASHLQRFSETRPNFSPHAKKAHDWLQLWWQNKKIEVHDAGSSLPPGGVNLSRYLEQLSVEGHRLVLRPSPWLPPELKAGDFAGLARFCRQAPGTQAETVRHRAADLIVSLSSSDVATVEACQVLAATAGSWMDQDFVQQQLLPGVTSDVYTQACASQELLVGYLEARPDQCGPLLGQLTRQPPPLQLGAGLVKVFQTAVRLGWKPDPPAREWALAMLVPAEQNPCLASAVRLNHALGQTSSAEVPDASGQFRPVGQVLAEQIPDLNRLLEKDFPLTELASLTDARSLAEAYQSELVGLTSLEELSASGKSRLMLLGRAGSPAERSELLDQLLPRLGFAPWDLRDTLRWLAQGHREHSRALLARPGMPDGARKELVLAELAMPKSISPAHEREREELIDSLEDADLIRWGAQECQTGPGFLAAAAVVRDASLKPTYEAAVSRLTPEEMTDKNGSLLAVGRHYGALLTGAGLGLAERMESIRFLTAVIPPEYLNVNQWAQGMRTRPAGRELLDSGAPVGQVLQAYQVITRDCPADQLEARELALLSLAQRQPKPDLIELAQKVSGLNLEEARRTGLTMPPLEAGVGVHESPSQVRVGSVTVRKRTG